MKLIYDGVDLATLGTLRLLAHSVQREPAEAPQRERVTYRVRLDFFEASFADNFSLIEQVRAALKTQNALLLWEDDNGATYAERTVTAADDESADEALTRGGTYWQALVFSFWFFNHDVATNALAATFQRPGGELLMLDTVEKFRQGLAVTRYDELRDARKLTAGSITASGRIQGDTTADLNTRRAALQDLKDTLVREMAAAATGTLIFGTFNRAVRLAEFEAEIDQPNNYIAWSLKAGFTVFPDESDYALIDLRIQNREVLADGIAFLTLAGKVGAPTAAKATARLATLIAALRPANFVTLAQETSEPRPQTESGTPDQGDGPVFTEIQFTVELRDAGSYACTFQRSVTNAPKVDLGTVDKFRDAFASQLFHELRPLRKRASGTLTLSGKWYAGDTLSAPAKVTALAAKKAALDAELLADSTGTLVYAALVNRVVRVIDFAADLNRVRNCIDWNLTATFTRFPNETDYAVCEFRLGTKQDRLEGTVVKTLAGKIGAQSPEAARAKLAGLRAALIPAGYVLKMDANEEERVSVKSGAAAAQDSFIELTVNEEWQQTSGAVLAYKLRRTDEDDAKSGWVRTTYAGTVTASGATALAAFATAEAQAAALGGGKFPFLVRASVSETSNQVLTDGQVLVAVEFAYEYQQRGAKIFTEVVAELSEEAFGASVETVSGVITAPTLALAQATYVNEVRSVAAYAGALLVNERRPTLAQQRLADALGNRLATLDDRYAFSFQVLRPKTDTQLAVRYALETAANLQTLERTLVVQGEVLASTEAVANAFLDTFLPGLVAGKRIAFARAPRYQQGPAVSGAGPAQVLVAVAFSETYVDALTGVVNGILRSECTEEITYSGNRLVEKPIPDGPPIIQKVGTTAARRVVTATADSTTEAAAQAWVRTVRAALISAAATYEEPPKVAVGFKFLPQTAGLPRGESANVLVYTISAQFSELLLVQPFV